MKKLKFKKRIDGQCPVHPDTLVVYRTTSELRPVSHIHHPIRAGDLNWATDVLFMGTILDYAEVV
jgi:hypothetical protein